MGHQIIDGTLQVATSLLGLGARDPVVDRDSTSTSHGTEPPAEIDEIDLASHVQRTVAFCDLSGFTAFCDTHGAHDAVAVLQTFRSGVRDLAAKRGVRVAKWMGDGALLVGVDPAPVVAAVVDLVARVEHPVLGVRGGVATGSVLLFDGDDYIGRPLNLASRLCDAAQRNEVLADTLSCADIPTWIGRQSRRPIVLKGLGRVGGLHVLRCKEPHRAQLLNLDADD
jgi:class 3 adenylate cyclase